MMACIQKIMPVLGMLAIGAGMIATAGCGTARRTEPIAPALLLSDPKLQRGQQAFYAHCHYCHPHGAAGLGPAIVNKPLPGFVITFQVRHGLGAMPSFHADRISTDELETVVAYIKAVHANKPAPKRVIPE